MSPPTPHYILARRQANNLLPISRFPDEVFLHIFEFNEDYQRRRLFRNEFPAWAKVFHVCHRWYTLGLHRPLFWDTVTNGCGLEATRELLSRSQRVPLNVCVKFSAEARFWNKDDEAADRIQALRARTEVPEELMKYMSRIKTLDITTVDSVWEPTPAAGEPTMLEVLKLTDCGEFYSADDNVTARWPFTVAIPKLRELTISVERLLYGVMRIPTLRFLSLELGREAEGSGYKIQDVLESLRQMPQLEKVDIHYALPTPTSEDVEELKRVSLVHLPNVQAFTCDDRVPALTLLLDHVVIPATCSLSVLCEAAAPSDIVATVLSLRTKLAVGGAPQARRHIRSLTVSSRQRKGRQGLDRAVHIAGCPHIHACLCADEADRHADCDDACVRVTIAYCPRNDEPWTVLNGLPEVLRLLPLEDVQSLSVDGPDVYNNFKADFDLIHSSEVATLPAPLALATAGACHFALPSPGFELEAKLRRLMPHLASVCVDVVQRKFPWEITLADEFESDDEDDDMDDDMGDDMDDME